MKLDDTAHVLKSVLLTANGCILHLLTWLSCKTVFTSSCIKSIQSCFPQPLVHLVKQNASHQNPVYKALRRRQKHLIWLVYAMAIPPRLESQWASCLYRPHWAPVSKSCLSVEESMVLTNFGHPTPTTDCHHDLFRALLPAVKTSLHPLANRILASTNLAWWRKGCLPYLDLNRLSLVAPTLHLSPFPRSPWACQHTRPYPRAAASLPLAAAVKCGASCCWRIP